MKSHLIFSIKSLELEPKDMTTESAVAGWEGSQRRTQEELEWERVYKALVGKCLLALGPSLWDLNEQSGKMWAVKQWCKARNCSTCLTVFQKKTSEVWEMGCICVHALWKMAQKTHLGMPLPRGSDDRGHLCNFILESEIDRRASCMLGMRSTTQVHSWLSSELFKTFVNALPHFKRRK